MQPPRLSIHVDFFLFYIYIKYAEHILMHIVFRKRAALLWHLGNRAVGRSKKSGGGSHYFSHILDGKD